MLHELKLGLFSLLYLITLSVWIYSVCRNVTYATQWSEGPTLVMRCLQRCLQHLSRLLCEV